MPRGRRRYGGPRTVSMSVMPPLTVSGTEVLPGSASYSGGRRESSRISHFSKSALMRQQRIYDDYVPMTRTGQMFLGLPPCPQRARGVLMAVTAPSAAPTCSPEAKRTGHPAGAGTPASAALPASRGRPRRRWATVRTDRWGGTVPQHGGVRGVCGRPPAATGVRWAAAAADIGRCAVRPSCRRRPVHPDLWTPLSAADTAAALSRARHASPAPAHPRRPAGNGRQPRCAVSGAAIRNLDAAGCPDGRCPPRTLPLPAGVRCYRNRSPGRRPLDGCRHRR
jgi:hypothetical protein